MTDYKVLHPQNLGAVDLSRGVILDVRTPMEHAEKHIGLPHIHVPLDTLNPAAFMTARGLGHDAAVYILCRSGKRAAQAASQFAAAGYNNVHVIEGGILSCEECGHDIQGHAAASQPTACGIPASRESCPACKIPLERQVRIAAGLIVAGGALLSLLVHPLFAVVPLAAGCGLVFAGVTDRCGVALLLTRAPWNKR